MDVRPYRIEPARAKRSIDAGEAVVIDLTSPFIGAAVKNQIPSATWISPRELLIGGHQRADVIRSLPDLPRDKTIITYCTCPDDEASARLTRVLREQGYDAWLLDGGLPAWRAAGYPMEAKAAA